MRVRFGFFVFAMIIGIFWLGRAWEFRESLPENIEARRQAEQQALNERAMKAANSIVYVKNEVGMCIAYYEDTRLPMQRVIMTVPCESVVEKLIGD